MPDSDPEFATVLIGVNDVVQGVPPETVRGQRRHDPRHAPRRLPADRIVTVAIPDYTVTPAGADYGDPGQQHDGIVANNAVMERLSGERGIAFVDIFDISWRAADDRSLVASLTLSTLDRPRFSWAEVLAHFGTFTSNLIAAS